ncbi:MAG: hydroxymethylglutaryl-CoA lyase [Rickettsiales bacterium]
MSHASITLVEVGARDGLQNEANAAALDAHTKAIFIRMLAQAGLTRIEGGSFVHPKAVPAMANSAEVAALLHAVEIDFPDVIFSYLVPNLKGLERATAIGAKEVAVFLALAESFSRANINVGVEESFAAIEPTIAAARAQHMRVRGYLSNLFGYSDYPFTPADVVKRTQQFLEMGCFEVSLGDTTGIGTPETTRSVMEALIATAVPLEKVAMHFHDTFGNAIANVAVAYDMGIRVFDASTGGLGGCPYANSPKGNLAMETLVAWAQSRSIGCAVTDIHLLEKAAHYMRTALGK